MSKTRWRWLVIPLILALVVTHLLYGRSLAEKKFAISWETTRIDGPLNPDGTINYVAALNEKFSQGVTKENNAAILLVRATGPKIFPKEIRKQALEILDIEPLPEKGDYFVPLEEYVKGRAFEDHSEIISTSKSAETGEEKELSGKKRSSLSRQQEEAKRQAKADLETLTKQSWSADNHPTMAAWLTANEKPLALIVASAKRPRYFLPLVPTSDPPEVFSIETANSSLYTEMAKALTARATLKLDSGDMEGAWADLQACRHLARLVGQGPRVLERLVAISAEGIACAGQEAIANSGNLTNERARCYLAELEGLSRLPQLANAIDTTERFMMLDCVMATYRKAPSNVDFDELLRRSNDWYDDTLLAFRMDRFAERTNALAALDQQLTESIKEAQKRAKQWLWMKAMFRGRRESRRIMTEIFWDLLSPVLFSFHRGSEFYDRAMMRGCLTKAAMALAVWMAEKGSYPESLDALVPSHLAVIPDDLFVNKPVRYQRRGKGYLLYSVGPNMKDDGGSDDREKGHDDIVVLVE